MFYETRESLYSRSHTYRIKRTACSSGNRWLPTPGLDGVLCHMDNILIYGSYQQTHDQRLPVAGIKLDGDES